MAERRLLYIESDGQVYLVERDGVWTFPDADERLDFTYEIRHSSKILDAHVSFCRPNLSSFPSHWVFKDDVPARRDIDPVVQRAINASIARCVVGALIVDPRGQVLMVKSNRGFTVGMWNVPGGFIEYGEEPAIAAAREAKEETGIVIEVGELLGVFMKRFDSPYFMYGFIYDAKPVSGVLRPEPTEIAEAKWMSPAEAMAQTQNPFAIQALSRRFRIPARPLPAKAPRVSAA